MVATKGPNAHVTGARTNPTSGELALARRFTPCDGHSHVVEKMSMPWRSAKAGQATNQTC